MHHEKSQVRKALVEPLGLVRDTPNSVLHSLACPSFANWLVVVAWPGILGASS